MIGKRIQPDENGWVTGVLNPGDYVRLAPVRKGDGSPLTEDQKQKWWFKPYWMCCAPNGHCVNLANHQVEEHEDGTITVTPSIIISRGGPASAGAEPYEQLWHGFLERGVWRSC